MGPSCCVFSALFLSVFYLVLKLFLTRPVFIVTHPVFIVTRPVNMIDTTAIFFELMEQSSASGQLLPLPFVMKWIQQPLEKLLKNERQGRPAATTARDSGADSNVTATTAARSRSGDSSVEDNGNEGPVIAPTRDSNTGEEVRRSEKSSFFA